MESRAGMMPLPLRTVVIGSGNVAWLLVPALEASGAIDVCQVYSRTFTHARELADKLHNAVPTDSLDALIKDAELYLVAVVDDAIGAVAQAVGPTTGVWLHTSGGVDAAVMAPATERYGVLYPLQTFSRGRKVEFNGIPIFIDGADEPTLELSRRLAQTLSSNVIVANGDMRRKLHAAAVFACNFTNHLWAVADDILRREAGVTIEVLRPLLEETMRKALDNRPADVQTGPARRGDSQVLASHMNLLAEDEARLYKILSQSIIDYYK